ncbi:hypothetical protein VTL71DRAFT_7340 [Oculimacula yallundae]|uniref:Uncharacterized protein n=1 Tax=Oculimacula yallundae TaxID=86028 RepID=A0ABR4BX49_9HELO
MDRLTYADKSIETINHSNTEGVVSRVGVPCPVSIRGRCAYVSAAWAAAQQEDDGSRKIKSEAYYIHTERHEVKRQSTLDHSIKASSACCKSVNTT